MPIEGYYKIDASRLSFAEAVRFSPVRVLGPLTWLALKLGGRRSQAVNYFPYPVRIDEMRVTTGELPSVIRDSLLREVAAVNSIGLGSPVFVQLTGALSSFVTESGGAHLRSPDGRMACFVLAAKTRIASQPPLRVERALYAALNNGTRIAVSSTRIGFDPPPGHRVIRLPGAGWEVLHRCLTEQLATLPPDALRLLDSDRALADEHDEYVEHLRRHHFERGIYVPLTRAEQEHAERLIGLVNSGQCKLPDSAEQARTNARSFGMLLFTVLIIAMLLVILRACPSAR